MRFTVKAKIVSLITVAVIVGSISIGAQAYNRARQALVKSVNKTLDEFSERVSQEIQFQNDAEFTLLHSLAELPVIKSEEVSIAEKCATFRNIINTNPDKYENIAFYDVEGNTSLPTGAPLQLKNKPYIETPAKTGKDYIQDPAFSSVNNSILMFMSVPVYNNSGKIIGCVVSVIKGNVLNNIAMKIEVSPGNHPNIINRVTGEIIAMGVDEGDQRLENNALDPNSDLVKIIKKITKGETGIDTYIDPIHKNKKIASYRPVENYNWSVFCPAPWIDFFADLKVLNFRISLIIIITIIIALTVSIVVVQLIFKPLKSVQKAFIALDSDNADLTIRVPLKTNDEIGDVVKGFNKFTEKVQTIIKELKQSKNEIAEVGDLLQVSASDTSIAISEISTNIESIHTQISNSSNSVNQSAAAVNEIASNIESLERMIDNQSNGVAQASSAVEQMIGNISSVNNSVDQMASSFEELYTKSIDGSKLQISVNEKIEEIREESETLQEANQVISSIASQTNLLAMNAAIEAAHAGEAGKGFSVVADEIRKLSENSTKQSETIGKQLDHIRASIQEVVDVQSQSSEAFKAVTEKIKITDNLVREIKDAMNEQNTGSMQINQSLHIMNNSTAEVKTASREMSEGNKSILIQMQALQDVTSEIKNNMDSMSLSITKINETGEGLSNISGQMNGTIEKIGDQIDLFRV